MANTTLTLQEVRDVADGTREFVFSRPVEYAFQAGQYVALMLPKLIAEDQKGPCRSLSIASAPYETNISFAMRNSESGFKKTCWKMRPGDTLSITKAIGSFIVPENETRPIVFLAGGIGITPVRSILKQAAYTGDGREFTLFYANRFLKDAAFFEELKTFPLKRYRLVSVLSQSKEPSLGENDERGYVCEAMLKKYLPDPSVCVYYLVGSPQFTDAMESMLDMMGIAKDTRHKDPFTGMYAQTKQPLI